MTEAQHSYQGPGRGPHENGVTRLQMTFTSEGLDRIYAYRARLAAETGRRYTLGMTLDALLKAHSLRLASEEAHALREPVLASARDMNLASRAFCR